MAQALERLGERWGLLIVRDLLPGERRFTDLQRSCGGVTPRQLSARLKQLEEAGIVEVDRQAGRRDVWYRLTEAGETLKPAVEALLLWGVQHIDRPPVGDEPVLPYHLMNGTRLALNAASRQPRAPVRWTWRFPDEPQTLALRRRDLAPDAGCGPGRGRGRRHDATGVGGARGGSRRAARVGGADGPHRSCCPRPGIQGRVLAARPSDLGDAHFRIRCARVGRPRRRRSPRLLADLSLAPEQLSSVATGGRPSGGSCGFMTSLTAGVAHLGTASRGRRGAHSSDVDRSPARRRRSRAGQVRGGRCGGCHRSFC